MQAFTQHCSVVPLAGIISPRPVTIPVQRPNAALLSGDPAKIAAFADEMLALERQREQDTAAEELTEGRTWPKQANPHDD